MILNVQKPLPTKAEGGVLRTIKINYDITFLDIKKFAVLPKELLF